MAINSINEFIWIGVVEDVDDPTRTGRIRVRVFGLFDDIETDTLPWAHPRKSIEGTEFRIPPMGKVVSVVFPEQNNYYFLEYWSTEHYDINLQKKLEALSATDYKDFTALHFNSDSRIYISNTEGTVMDYKSSAINITPNRNIDLLLGARSSKIHLGTFDAQQSVILGNNYLDWEEQLLNLFKTNTAFIGNAGAPIIASPQLLAIIELFLSQKEPNFLSHFVFTPNNSDFSANVRADETIVQEGDNWTANKKTNEVTITVPNADKILVPGDTPVIVIPPKGSPVFTDAVNTSKILADQQIEQTKSNEGLVETLISVMRNKGYKIFEEPWVLNIVGIRNAVSATQSNITDIFDDHMVVFYKTEKNGSWQHKTFAITTDPGKYYTSGGFKDFGQSGVAILKPGQYAAWKFGSHHKTDALIQMAGQVTVYRDGNRDQIYNTTPENLKSKAAGETATGFFGINIHSSVTSGLSTIIYNWSAGCQVFKGGNEWSTFIGLVKKHLQFNPKKTTFTYTLLIGPDVPGWSPGKLPK